MHGCTHYDAPHFSTDYPPGLSIQFDSKEYVFESANTAKITARIVNRSQEPLTFYTHDLADSHNLQVFNAARERIPTIPPPQPISKRESNMYRHALQPGESYPITYSLDIFSPPLPKGRYRIVAQRVPSTMAHVSLKLDAE